MSGQSLAERWAAREIWLAVKGSEILTWTHTVATWVDNWGSGIWERVSSNQKSGALRWRSGGRQWTRTTDLLRVEQVL